MDKKQLKGQRNKTSYDIPEEKNCLNPLCGKVLTSEHPAVLKFNIIFDELSYEGKQGFIGPREKKGNTCHTCYQSAKIGFDRAVEGAKDAKQKHDEEREKALELAEELGVPSTLKCGHQIKSQYSIAANGKHYTSYLCVEGHVTYWAPVGPIPFADSIELAGNIMDLRKDDEPGISSIPFLPETEVGKGTLNTALDWWMECRGLVVMIKELEAYRYMRSKSHLQVVRREASLMMSRGVVAYDIYELLLRDINRLKDLDEGDAGKIKEAARVFREDVVAAETDSDRERCLKDGLDALGDLDLGVGIDEVVDELQGSLEALMSSSLYRTYPGEPLPAEHGPRPVDHGPSTLEVEVNGETGNDQDA